MPETPPVDAAHLPQQQELIAALCSLSYKNEVALAQCATLLYKVHALETSSTPFMFPLGITDREFAAEIRRVTGESESEDALPANGRAAVDDVWATLKRMVVADSNDDGAQLEESGLCAHVVRQLFEAMMMRAARTVSENKGKVHHGFVHDTVAEFGARLAVTVMLARNQRLRDGPWTSSVLAESQPPLSTLEMQYQDQMHAFAASSGFSEELHPQGYIEALRARDMYNHLRRICPLALGDNAEPPFSAPLREHLGGGIDLMLRNSWAHVVDQWRASKEWRYFSENTEWKLLAPSLSKLNSLCYELAGSSAKRQLHIFRAAAKTMLEPMTEAQRGACLAACPELLVAVPKDQMSEMSSRLLPWVEVCLTQNRGIFNSLACLLAATASGRVVEPTAFVSLLLSWAAPSDADDGIDVAEASKPAEAATPEESLWPPAQWVGQKDNVPDWPAEFCQFTRQEESVLTIGAEMVFYARLRGLWKHLKETNKPPAVRVQAVLRVCVDRLQNLMNLAFLLLCAHQGIDSPPDEYFPETKLPLIAAVRKELDKDVCDKCGAVATAESFKSCAGCGRRKYCGKECQKEAWPSHKLECAQLKTGVLVPLV